MSDDLRVTDVRIAAADGIDLGGTVFTPPAERSSAVVVMSAAAGLRRSFYKRFAAYLAARGLTVVTYDYRGIGDSRPRSLRGFAATMADWGILDFEGVLRWAQREYAGRPLAVVGHSLGGWNVGLAASNSSIARVVTVCTSSADWRLWPLRLWPMVLGIWYFLMPLATRIWGYYPGYLIGGQLPREVALQWVRWARTRGFFLRGDDSIRREGFSKVRAPILSLSFSDDSFAPPRAVAALHDLFEHATVIRRSFHPGELGTKKVGHLGFFRDRFRASLWTTVADFLLMTERPVQDCSLSSLTPLPRASARATRP